MAHHRARVFIFFLFLFLQPQRFTLFYRVDAGLFKVFFIGFVYWITEFSHI